MKLRQGKVSDRREGRFVVIVKPFQALVMILQKTKKSKSNYSKNH